MNPNWSSLLWFKKYRKCVLFTFAWKEQDPSFEDNQSCYVTIAREKKFLDVTWIQAQCCATPRRHETVTLGWYEVQ